MGCDHADGLLAPAGRPSRHIVHQQLDHIFQHMPLFEHHTGCSGPTGLVEYFANNIGNDKEDIYWRLCDDLGLAPQVEHTPDVIHATMLWPRTGPEWSPLVESAWPEPKEAPVTTTQTDDDALETRVQSAVAKALESLMGGAPQAPDLTQESFEHVLSRVDPADSEAALAMLDFLLKTGRLGRVGVLDNGGGYLFMYQEPKGSSKQGYVPGATKGDRIVDRAVEAQREANGGKPPAKRGVCKFCISAIAENEDGTVVLDGSTDPHGAHCDASPHGVHAFA